MSARSARARSSARQQRDVDRQRGGGRGGHSARYEDPQRLFDILSTSGGRSHRFLKRFPNVLAGDFTPYFVIGLSRKVVSLALGMAAKLEVPMFVASTVRQVYEAAHPQGFGQLDMAAVTKLYEHWIGVAVRGAAAKADTTPGQTDPRFATGSTELKASIGSLQLARRQSRN